MAPQYKSGETVRYKPVGGTSLSSVSPSSTLTVTISTGPDSNTPESTGTIKNVLTEPGRQAERNVQASEDDPRYEVCLRTLAFAGIFHPNVSLDRELEHWEAHHHLREEHPWEGVKRAAKLELLCLNHLNHLSLHEMYYS